MKLRAALLALILSAAPALAAYRVTFDPGGSIQAYIEKYHAIQDAGGSVVIDGPCISACTLVTAIVDDAHVCVTHRARLVFHSATTMNGQHASEGTRLIWNMYPGYIRAMLIKKGWDGDDGKANEHSELIYIEGDELRIIYRDCPSV
jgi:hypothetical protein